MRTATPADVLEGRARWCGEAAYAEVCRERLEAESRGLTLKAARAGQLPLLGGDGRADW